MHDFKKIIWTVISLIWGKELRDYGGSHAGGQWEESQALVKGD